MSKTLRIKHECASKGIAVGNAHIISVSGTSYPRFWISDKEIALEMARFKNAIQRSKHQISKVKEKLCKFQDKEQIQIIDTHAMLLQDEMLITHAIQNIASQKINAEWALDKATTKLKMAFVDMHDEYFRQRKHDIDYIGRRIMRNLLERPDTPDIGTKEKNLILIGHDFSPADIVNFPRDRVLGFIAEVGGATSHSAIIARSLEIPAMFGVENITKQIASGDVVIIDGPNDLLIINPSEKEIREYKTLRTAYYKEQRELIKEACLPAQTLDQNKIDILANIELPEEIDPSIEHGAEGIGLFRTEYLYANRMDNPSEDEQFEIYKLTLEKMSPRPVTIRTLDIGGDKTVPYLGHHHKEANPFLGWRSIRLSFEHPEIFLTQLRAILRAAALARGKRGEVRVMFPMITTLEEINRVRKMVRRACVQLEAEGKDYVAAPIGMMLEVPAAAISIDTLLHAVDFVSIGSNDLVQYLMAADRDNPKVSHLCQPLAPPVLQVLARIVESCVRAGKPLTLCGEMAAQPRAFVLLLGMGLRSFSMSPAFVPSLKDLASHVTIPHARELLRRAVRMKTTARIKHFMRDELQRIAPNLSLLDSE